MYGAVRRLKLEIVGTKGMLFLRGQSWLCVEIVAVNPVIFDACWGRCKNPGHGQMSVWPDDKVFLQPASIDAG